MHRARPLFILVTTFTALTLSLGAGAGTPALGAGCTGVQLHPSDNVAARINADPGKAATTFCLSAGSYAVGTTIQLATGDKMIGPSGAVTTRGPASYGTPTVKIHSPASLTTVIQITGNNTMLSWLDISGGEAAVGAGRGGTGTVLQYLAIHDTARAGISSMNGNLLHSNLYNNSTNRSFWGDNASAVKGTTEYQAAYNYVHNNLANGVWCDVGCASAGAGMPNGFWVHDNLVVNNGRWGVRYEHSPIVGSGVHLGNPTALVEDNSFHGNGTQTSGSYGGASMWDSQNATFRNNVFGAATVAGVNYGADAHGLSIRFYDSGQRTDLWNGAAVSNSLRGETISGCTLPDSVVVCSSNTP
jgi:hypothetical protein